MLAGRCCNRFQESSTSLVKAFGKVVHEFYALFWLQFRPQVSDPHIQRVASLRQLIGILDSRQQVQFVVKSVSGWNMQVGLILLQIHTVNVDTTQFLAHPHVV